MTSLSMRCVVSRSANPSIRSVKPGWICSYSASSLGAGYGELRRLKLCLTTSPLTERDSKAASAPKCSCGPLEGFLRAGGSAPLNGRRVCGAQCDPRPAGGRARTGRRLAVARSPCIRVGASRLRSHCGPPIARIAYCARSSVWLAACPERPRRQGRGRLLVRGRIALLGRVSVPTYRKQSLRHMPGRSLAHSSISASSLDSMLAVLPTPVSAPPGERQRRPHRAASPALPIVSAAVNRVGPLPISTTPGVVTAGRARVAAARALHHAAALRAGGPEIEALQAGGDDRG